MRCRCEADEEHKGPKVTVLRGKPAVKKTSRVVSHFRRRDNAHFWHWEDQAWDLIKPEEAYTG